MNPNLLTPLSVTLARTLTLAMLALLTGCAQPPAAVPPASTPSSAAVPPAATASAFLPPETPSGYTPKAIAFAQTDMVSAANPLAVQWLLQLEALRYGKTDAAGALRTARTQLRTMRWLSP